MLKHLRSRFDCIITSPPYFNVRNYGPANQMGHGQNLDDFLRDTESVFGLLLERASEDGMLWIIADAIRQNGRFVPLPNLFAERAERAGWHWQSELVWEKDRTYPWLGQGRLRKIHETILLLSRKANPRLRIDRLRHADAVSEWWLRYPERYNPFGRAPSDVWQEAIPSQGSWGRPFLKHECPLPPGLIERMVELSTDPGQKVLDPFAGTGVVAATAAAMGRHGTAIEIAPQFESHFWTEVIPAVRTWWDGRLVERQRMQLHDEAFYRANVGLRAVKYMRLVVEHLNATAGRTVVAGAWAQARASRAGPPWVSGKLLLMRRGSGDGDAMLAQQAELFAAKAPLSKFGVHLRVEVVEPSRFTRGTAGYIYSGRGTAISTRTCSRREFGLLLSSRDEPAYGGELLISAGDVLHVSTRGWRGRDVDHGFGPEQMTLAEGALSAPRLRP